MRSRLFGSSLLFYNDSLLFYLLFSEKLIMSVSVSYKMASYMRDSTVLNIQVKLKYGSKNM